MKMLETEKHFDPSCHVVLRDKGTGGALAPFLHPLDSPQRGVQVQANHPLLRTLSIHVRTTSLVPEGVRYVAGVDCRLRY